MQPSFRIVLAVTLLTIFPVLSIAAEQTVTPLAETARRTPAESWTLLYADGKRIGFGHTSFQISERDGKTIRTSKEEGSIVFRRFGQENRFRVEQITEGDETGKLLGFTHRMTPQEGSGVEMIGRLTDGKWTVKINQAGQKAEQHPDWKHLSDPNRYSWDSLLPLLQKDRALSFDTLLLDYLKPVTKTVTYAGQEKIALPDGTEKTLHRVKISVKGLPDMDSDGWIDESGVVWKTLGKAAGLEFLSVKVSKEEAMKKLESADLDIAVRTLVKVKGLKDPHSEQKKTYKVTLTSSDPAAVLPSDGTQQVSRIDDRSSNVVVTSAEIPKTAVTATIDAEYLASSRYLQCAHKKVIFHADNAAGSETDPVRTAIAMEKYVRKVIKDKNFSTALGTAAEVAESLEGDCTEHAVLLAAMLRVKKIPSRVATGMVYVSSLSAFGGHMWTEAYLNGKWIPLDATLGKGGIGVGHIKLSTSSFSDAEGDPAAEFLPLTGIIGNMKIEVVNEAD